MTVRLERERTETGRQDAGSRVWEGMKGKFAVSAVLLATGCAPAHVFQPSIPELPARSDVQSTQAQTQPQEQFSSMVLQSGRTSAGQTEVGLAREVVDGRAHIRANANVAGEGSRFMWFFFQENSGQQYLLNPRYAETSQPRYIGVVMRNATLTDGTSGDFVVRVYGNATAPEGAGELSPVAERDGRLQPGNVVLRLMDGSLVPARDPLFLDSASDAGRYSASASASVEEFGPTTAVVAVLRKMAAATGSIEDSTGILTHGDTQ